MWHPGKNGMFIHQPFTEYCNPPETGLGTGDTKVGKILSYLGFSTVIDIEVDSPSSIPALLLGVLAT